MNRPSRVTFFDNGCQHKGLSVSEEATESASDKWVGKRLSGRYLVERSLGHGAMGSVYLARHEALNKRVAIKLLNAELTGRAEMLERFRREAQAAAIIEHPNVCATSDFATADDGSFFLAMEYLEGRTLGELLQAGAVETQRTLDIAQQICAGLARAHKLGIVHRDLKPDNIMLVHRGQDPDFVKLLDFGIAHVAFDTPGQDVRLTQEGKVYGTPRYLSPEQACGDSVDHRADLYALGVILFEMLAGRPPFESESAVELIRMQLITPPPTLSGLGVRVPARLEAIVMRLLSKTPAARGAGATSLREELLAVGEELSSTPSLADRTTTPPPEGSTDVVADSSVGRRSERSGGVELESAPTLASFTERPFHGDDPSDARELGAIKPEVARLIPAELARRHQVIAMDRQGRWLRVAMAQPTDQQAIADIEFLTGFRVQPVAISTDALRVAFDKHLTGLD